MFDALTSRKMSADLIEIRLEVKVRTTLDIDEDVLLATKEIAKRKSQSMGKVLSELARQALTRQAEATTRNDVPLFPKQPNASIVTLELVNRLRDEIP